MILTTIQCNGPGCRNTFTGLPLERAHSVRRRAAEVGWVQTNAKDYRDPSGKYDYCRECAENIKRKEAKP